MAKPGSRSRSLPTRASRHCRSLAKRPGRRHRPQQRVMNRRVCRMPRASVGTDPRRIVMGGSGSRTRRTSSRLPRVLVAAAGPLWVDRNGIPRVGADGQVQMRRTRVDGHIPGQEIVERKFTQLAAAGPRPPSATYAKPRPSTRKRPRSSGTRTERELGRGAVAGAARPRGASATGPVAAASP
jgi:hypothetical protein